MKPEQDHIKTYSAADIQQYLEGRLSSAEMHAIEKAALDDPFLADAIEGYMVGSKEQQNKDLQSLNIQLQERIKNAKKNRLLTPVWLRAAIIVLAVSAGGLTIYNLFNKNTESENAPLAKNEKIGPAKSDTTAVNAQPKIDSQAVVQAETKSYKKEDDKKRAKEQPSVPEQRIVAAPSASAAKEVTAEAPAPLKDQAAQQTRGVAADRESQDKREVATLEQDKLMNAFSGRVLDSKNKPVAGATIVANNRRTAVVSDLNGQFNISAPDTALSVEVNSVGFEKYNATLSNNNRALNNIILKDSNASLDEVVVVGNGAAKSRKVTSTQKLDSTLNDVEPIVSWDEYNSYINSNKRKPAGQDDIDGEVILSFEVNQNNTLSNIKIEQSLTKELDKEAIRLIKEGPQWKSKKGKKAKGKLAIRF